MTNYTRILGIVALIVFSLLWVLAKAGWTETGMLKGQVINASQDSIGVKAIGVTLRVFQKGQELQSEKAQTVTDGYGRFAFKNLRTDTTILYVPMVLYQGLEFYGNVVGFSQKKVAFSQIVVYDTTGQADSIHVIRGHFILEPGRNILRVRELYLFQNTGRKVYVGQMSPVIGRRVTLALELPEGYRNLSIGSDFDPHRIFVEGRNFYDTMEFRPGPRTGSIFYELPYSGSKFLFRRRLLKGLRKVDLFVPAKVKVDSPEFQFASFFNLGGKSFQRFLALDLEEGAFLEVRLRNLPSSGLRPWMWAIIALVGILAVGGVIYRLRKRGREHSIPKEERLQRQKQQLLDRIVRLDELWEKGQVEEAKYVQERELLKKELILINMELERKE